MQTGYYSTQVISKLQEIVDNGITVSNTDFSTVATNTTDISSDTSYMEDHLSFIKTDAASIATSTSNTSVATNTIAQCVWVDENQVKVDLKTLNDTTIETNIGNVTAGCQRVCIATDDVNISSLASCVDIFNTQLKVNVGAINEEVPSMNAGYLSNGTQRVCIATDDVNLGGVSTEIAKLSAVVDVATSAAQVDLKTIKNISIESNQGYLSNGTQRVCIATDDVNLGKMLTNSSTTVDAFHVNLRSVYTAGSGDVDLTTSNGNKTAGTLRVCIATDDINLSSLNTNITNLYTILNDVWDSTNHYLRTHETA